MKIYNYNGAANLAGLRIRQARMELGLSQDELAARLQVQNVILSQKCISRMEKGNDSSRTMSFSFYPKF